MFEMLTDEELRLYIHHETNYEESNPGLQYVFYRYNDMFRDHGYIPNAPLQVGLNLTNACNLKCLHCSRRVDKSEMQRSNENKFMENWKEILDILANSGVVQVFLSGGEPTLHPDIVDIICYAKQRRLKLALLTNGTKINSELLDVLAVHFSNEIDYVHLSIDDLNGDFEAIRRGGSFKTVDSTLESLASCGINTRVATTVSKKNVGHIFDVYEYCVNKDVGSIRFIPMFLRTPTSFGASDEVRAIKEFCKILSHKRNSGAKIKIISSPNRSVYPFSEWLRNYRDDLKLSFQTDSFVCPATVSSCEISPDGFVYPCSYFDQEDFYAGNIFDTSFLDIWGRGINWGYIRNKEYIDKECALCGEFSKCSSGCPAENYFKVNPCELLKRGGRF